MSRGQHTSGRAGLIVVGLAGAVMGLATVASLLKLGQGTSSTAAPNVPMASAPATDVTPTPNRTPGRPSTVAATTIIPGAGTVNGAGEASRQATYILTEENTKDIWSTSVYSYAAGGGGPGGGLANDYLRVGGWGDEYVSLIKFDLPPGPCANHAVLRLFNMPDGASPTPMRLFVISQAWSWALGDRLWWRDLPLVVDSSSGEVATPPVNGWLSIDISAIYGRWCSGTIANNGIMLRPVKKNNNYNHFASTRYIGDGDRLPRLVLSSQ